MQVRLSSPTWTDADGGGLPRSPKTSEVFDRRLVSDWYAQPLAAYLLPTVDAVAHHIPWPAFEPPWWLRGGHAQTLAGYFSRRGAALAGERHRVPVSRGDVLVLHDNRPESWSASRPAALVLHGLAGCHASPYVVRLGRKLMARGARVFRLDFRGCGAGAGLARWPYHAGCSDDVRAALATVAGLCPASPLLLVGYSLGGNVLLKLLGEDAAELPTQPIRAAAVNPPVDLAGCVAALDRPVNRIYEAFFLRLLRKQLAAAARAFPDAAHFNQAKGARRLREFDDRYTAPLSGFSGAAEYYETCSARNFISRIRTPTLILSAADDPLVPAAGFSRLECPPAVQLHVAAEGGHLGYIARRSAGHDGHWMDGRILEWLTAK